jgi:acyl carrier protein
MRHVPAVALLALGLLAAPPGNALPPVPLHEIIDTVRELAAAQIGRPAAEINTVQSLFAQGLTENGLTELISAINLEFGIVIPDSEIHRAKWNDAVSGFSCRRLADLVAAQMHEQ